MSFPTPLLRRYAATILAALACSGMAVAQEVWVFTESGRPLRGTHAPARTVELDAAQRIETELAAGLPGDPQQAEPIARRRLQGGGIAFQRRLQTAYQGITDAWSLGITTLPAVLVDQRYVVYGEADLDKALARIAQYRRERP